MIENKVVLITGASSGIGYQTAELLANLNYHVYGAARHVSKMDDLKKIGVKPLKMDLTDELSIIEAIAEIIEIEGRIEIT